MSIHDTMTENEQENPGEEEKKGESDSPGETNENIDKDGEEKEEKDDKDKEPIIDPKDWPLIGIKEHSDNDVLFGRGGKVSASNFRIFVWTVYSCDCLDSKYNDRLTALVLLCDYLA